MPGTIRPYTLPDILGQLLSASQDTSGSIVPNQGFFSPTNENAAFTDHVTGTVTTNPNWNAGTWGLAVWS